MGLFKWQIIKKYTSERDAPTYDMKNTGMNSDKQFKIRLR